MKRSLVLFSFVYAITACAQTNCSSLRYQQPVFDSVAITSGIYFGTATPYGVLALPQDLYLDFYEPYGDTLSKRPLIVFQFGGGFAIGWRSEPVIPDFCKFFAQHGYAVASIDYRLGFNVDSQSTVRAMYRAMQDERAALRFLAANANLFRIDTNNIFLTGTSAGCFSALGNCFMSEADRPASTYGYLLEPNDLGCMDCSGNNLFGKRIPKIKAIINQWGAILDTALITANENIPVISFHGDQDLLVPYEYGFPFQLPVFPSVYGSKPIHERLTHLGILNELRPLVGFGHEPELLNPQLNDTIRNYSRNFLFKLLKPNTSVISGEAAVCKSQSVTYSVTNTAGSSYCWTLSGNGTITQTTGNSITVLWNDTGNVSVAVKELNYLKAEGDEQTFTTYVAPDVKANFGFVKNELEVLLSNWSVNAVNFLWSFGDGTFSTDINPVKNYTTGGTYLIKLIADNNICSDTFTTTLLVDSCPVAFFGYQLTNFNGFFNAHVTNTTYYSWNFGDGDTAKVTYPNVIHIYQQPGTYTVTLKVKNQPGCEEIYTETININTTGIVSHSKSEETIQCNSRGECVISTTEKQQAVVEVFDISGKRVMQLNTPTAVIFYLKELTAGTYLVKASTPNGLLIKKVILQ
jgi:PKD repeat protein